MARNFLDLTFTPSVVETQLKFGHKQGQRMTQARGTAEMPDDLLSTFEKEFIESRDSFYMATVNEDGWPYVQHRGGPTGFLKVLDEKTLAYADFRGNQQMLSMGNLQDNARASIFLMDYARQRRLKLLAHSEFVDARNASGSMDEILKRLSDPSYASHIERIVFFHVVAFDWNCPQHITPRFTESEWRALPSNETTAN
ncbi:MAG: pyridoxamine 5'-phosphate oxidase family protein [Planctomycetota bacterium]|nr:pyridoxamine 5'-phosphate oxidase family protein [Planctomycetota bacterium]